MSDLVFQAGGPLLANSPVYVTRDADAQAAAHLRRMEYITLVEARANGKTSLINHLIGEFSARSYAFAVRDLAAAKPSATTTADWYAALGTWLLRQLPFLGQKPSPKLPHDSSSWEEFLAEVARQAQTAGQKVVIALDEIGAMPPGIGTDFFSVLRSIYTSRQSFPFWQNLTFIIAGAFNPKELIQDASISNFNIDQRIPLDDLTLPQVRHLAAFLALERETTRAVAERIFYWTDGQPYLTQRLCLSLAEWKERLTPATPIHFHQGLPARLRDLVDEAVARFFHDDTHHLARIKDLAAQPDLLEYTLRITRGTPARFSPGLNDRHFHLAHILGVIKADAQGRCRIRNRIYEKALQEVEQADSRQQTADGTPAQVSRGLREKQTEAVPTTEDSFRFDAFISYSHKNHAWVHDTLLPRLEREGLAICIDTRDFEIGVPSLVNIEKAIASSRRTLLVLTPDWVASNWTDFEALLTQTEDPAGRGHRILPLLVEPCTLPKRLRVFTYLDLSDPANFDFQIKRLVAAIRSTLSPPLRYEDLRLRIAAGEAPTAPPRPKAREFSYEHGLARLSQELAQADVETRMSFAVLESRLLDNLQDEHRYGSNEALRSDRARILRELNRLTFTFLERSFNDLCEG